MNTQDRRLIEDYLPILAISAEAEVGDFPDAFHLFAAVQAPHQGVVELVAAFLVAPGPDNRLGGVGEVSAAEVRRGIGFDPGDVVQQLKAEALHGVADGMDDVGRAADPDGPVGLQEPAALAEPAKSEVVVGLGALGLVPFALVHAHHLPRMAGDAVIGEEVGRVGEDEVEGGFGHAGHQVEAVAFVEAEAAVGGFEVGGRQFHVQGS